MRMVVTSMRTHSTGVSCLKFIQSAAVQAYTDHSYKLQCRSVFIPSDVLPSSWVMCTLRTRASRTITADGWTHDTRLRGKFSGIADITNVPWIAQRISTAPSAVQNVEESQGREKSRAQPRQATTLDGKQSSVTWLDELREPVSQVTRALGRPPGLCVIHVGERSDSSLYVSKKEEVCKQVLRFPSDVTQSELHAAIDQVCLDDDIDGVLVQLPLPPHLNELDVMERIDPRKDVDGFHPINMGRMLARSAPPRFVPATALGCMKLLECYNVSVTKKHIVVIGDSNIVGTPLAVLLRDAGASTVTVCHRISYLNLFHDRHAPQSRDEVWKQATPCLPRLPGPYTRTQSSKNTSPDGIHSAQEMPHARVSAEPNPQQMDKIEESLSCSQSRIYVKQHSDTTEVTVKAKNRSNLLSSLCTAFYELGLLVKSATVHTSEDTSRVCNVFHLSNSAGGPVQDARMLRRLSVSLRDKLGGVVGEEANGWDDGRLAALARTADVLVVAVGFPELVRSGWIKPGAVVLDVGINVVPHKELRYDCPVQTHTSSPQSSKCKEPSNGSWVGHVVGDVAHKEVSCLASALTPVPGGVGPMTIAALVHNVVLAAKYRAGIVPW